MREKQIRGPLLFILACLGVLQWVCLRSAYVGGEFAFHDLGLINDLLSNAAFHGKPFYVTDYGIHHFSIHFTPSLLLLVPFYWIFNSPFLLIALGIGADLLFLYFAFRVFESLLRERFTGKFVSRGGLLFSLLLGTHLFNKTVLASAHFEIFYMPAAMACFYYLIRDERSRVQAFLAAWIALGVRQDAGLYLFFQLLALAWIRKRGRRPYGASLALATFSAIYLGVAVKGLMPLWGGGSDTVQWKHWGASWPAVFAGFLSSPLEVLRDLAHSALPLLNATFGALPWVDPLVALGIHAPGVLLATASSSDKNQIWYYNAGFLLPGFALATIWAVRFFHTPIRRKILIGLTVALAIVQLARLPAVHGPGPSFKLRRDDAAFTRFQSALRLAERLCPGFQSLSTDMKALAFVPLRTERYLLRNFMKADLVLLNPQGTPFWSGHDTMTAVEEAVRQTPGFRLSPEAAGGYRIYLKTVSCEVR